MSRLKERERPYYSILLLTVRETQTTQRERGAHEPTPPESRKKKGGLRSLSLSLPQQAFARRSPVGPLTYTGREREVCSTRRGPEKGIIFVCLSLLSLDSLFDDGPLATHGATQARGGHERRPLPYAAYERYTERKRVNELIDCTFWEVEESFLGNLVLVKQATTTVCTTCTITPVSYF